MHRGIAMKKRLTFEYCQRYADGTGAVIEKIGSRHWQVWHPSVQGVTVDVFSVLELYSEIHEFHQLAEKKELEFPEETKGITIDIV